MITPERGDIIILDDPYNDTKGDTEAERQKALLWYERTLDARINHHMLFIGQTDGEGA